MVKAVDGKRTILTFSDIAGEACNEDTGHVDIAMLQEQFKTALTCDAYVLCFDTSDDREHKATGIVGTAAKIYNWAKEIQEQRLANCDAVGFVPMMVLFTKCKELEDEDANFHVEMQELMPHEKIHLFASEVQKMKFAPNKQIYKNLSDKIDDMESAYYAQLRCSPYGFAASPRPEGHEGSNERLPNPRNVEKLASWLLYVTGCLPVKLANYADMDNYYVEPPLCRNQRADELLNVNLARASMFGLLPNKSALMPVAMNAVVRCYLFKNPDFYDENYTNHYNEPFNLLADLREARSGHNS
jgi:hypothetical protein